MDPAGEQRLYHLLQLAAHRLKVMADRDSHGVASVTAAQAAVMFVVARSPGSTQRGVAEQLQQQESAVTAMVGKLLEAGLIDRAPSPSDNRAWSLTLTPAGEAALAAFRPRLEAMNRNMTAALGGAAGVEALAQALRAILAIEPGGTRGDRS